MSLDFPSSPTNGQVFGNFYYDSSITAWRNLGSKNALSDSIKTVANSVGLTPIVPPTVTISGGSATANALGVVTFTSATSVKLNNVFSASFLNYKVLIDITTGAAVDNSLMFIKIDGAGATSYFYSGTRQYATTNDVVTNASTNLWQIGPAGRSGGAGGAYDVTIFKPFAAANTKYNSHGGGQATAAGEQQQYILRGRVNDTTSYTGFEIAPVSSNISGTIQVFGYNS
jgi:hypothetical protein